MGQVSTLTTETTENTDRQLSLLSATEGELLLVRISSDARQLEEVLEAVAELSFPVNPEIRHHGARSIVEFPAYSNRLTEVREVLRATGISGEITHQSANGALSA